jgi:hypothetical protein
MLDQQMQEIFHARVWCYPVNQDIPNQNTDQDRAGLLTINSGLLKAKQRADIDTIAM